MPTQEPKTIEFPPKRKGDPEVHVEANNPIVILGPNGTGKSRLSLWVKDKLTDKNSYRVSANRNLTIPDKTNSRMPSYNDAIKELEFGETTSTNQNAKQSNKPATIIQTDFEKLIAVLISSHIAQAINDREVEKKQESLLEKTMKIWEVFFPEKPLKFIPDENKIKVSSNPGQTHSISELSDGQRAILYFLGQCLAFFHKAYMIIDEPEGNLHKAIVQKLWDEIEKACPNTTFIYITHDVDFAVSRKGAIKICVESYTHRDQWTWNYVHENDAIPEEILLKIVGTRKPVLFVEGKKNSLDMFFYEIIYSDFLIIPLGGCEAIIHAVSTFNKASNSTLHHIESHGIIDRDYKDSTELSSLPKNIYFFEDFSEIENFLLSEEVLRFFLEESQGITNTKERDTIIENIINKIKNYFVTHKQRHVDEKVISVISKKTINTQGIGIDEIEKSFSEKIRSVNVKDIYQEIQQEADKAENNHKVILKIFKCKGLLHNVLSAIPDFKTAGYKNTLKNVANKNTEKFRETVSKITPIITRETQPPINNS